jgi:hypothetical protein
MNCSKRSCICMPSLSRQFFAIGTLLAATLLSPFSLVTAAEEVWSPVTDTSLIVREGSALDFSSMVSPDSAGTQGQLRVSPQGNFEFAGLPGKRQRFWSASVAFSPPNGGFPSHQFADLYARQLRLHGYNMIRLQQVDAMLMVGRQTDFDFDPEQLDRFQYFLSALKSQGVYWVIDILTSGNGAYGGNIPNRWADKYSMKSGVYFDAERQRHWKQLATTLLATKNPYTGLKMAEDPALAGVILVNENGLTFLAYIHRSTYPEGLAPMFGTWLRKRHGSEARLRAAWGKELHADELQSTGAVRLPSSMKERSERMRDFLRFIVDLEASTVDWMTKHVRDLGYAGPLTSLNNVGHLHADYARRTLGWIDMHAYLAEPNAYVSPGSEMPQKSSLERRLPYFRELAAARQIGKPFTVTEYGQPFWNSWRREAGLAIGAYGRLQDWDMICQYGENSIELSMAPSRLARKNTIMPFGLGLDPVARASETLAGLLFQRGDVRPAINRVVVGVDEERVFQAGDSADSMPGDLSAMALVTGLGVNFDTMVAPAAGDKKRVVAMGLEPEGLGRHLVRLEKWMDGDPTGRVSKRVATLRQAGVLNTKNRTNADAGIFHSDTEEILLDVSRRALSVITPLTEALSFDSLPAPRKGRMQVISASGPALVALSSLDGKALPASRRILGILATDAINTGMTFNDAERKKLASLGTLPARILAGNVVVELESTTGAELVLYALKLNGERAETLPVERTASGIRFKLDTIQPHGPTTFFELVAK